jgi:hypothetical protein
MGKLILVNADLVIDGTNLSKRSTQVSVDAQSDEVDLTAFQEEWKDTGVGLKDATMQITFIQDLEVGMVDDVLWPLFRSGEEFVIEAKATKAPKGPGNPLWKMGTKLFNYSPLSGSVGQASTTQVTFKNTSETGLERLTE